jgi:F-type H+-transporting ATPase subunit epsilon
MRVEIVSPEKVLYSGEATQVVTRTLSGDIAFLAGHSPFLGALAENHTRIYLTDGTIQDVAVHRGFVEVSNDVVSILSDTAELAADIDVPRAREAKSRAEKGILEGDEDAPAALSRATARLAAAGAETVTH